MQILYLCNGFPSVVFCGKWKNTMSLTHICTCFSCHISTQYLIVYIPIHTDGMIQGGKSTHPIYNFDKYIPDCFDESMGNYARKHKGFYGYAYMGYVPSTIICQLECPVSKSLRIKFRGCNTPSGLDWKPRSIYSTIDMDTAWHGITVPITDPLLGESSRHRWIRRKKYQWIIATKFSPWTFVLHLVD